MAVQKNFIIRNGLEVNNNLLVVDISSDRVGIGTSNPKNTLEVIGGIGVTDVNILGIGTVLTEFNVGSGGTVITSLNTGLTGFGTHSPGYIVDIRSPVSSGQTALYVQGDVKITGDLYADDISFDQSTVVNLEVSGIASVATGIVTNLTTTGVTSIATGIVTNLRVSGIASIATGIVTNLRTTGIASIATGVVTTGFINTGIITTLSGSNISYSGIGSFGSINADIGRINTGIVTNLTTTGIASIATGVLTTGFINTGIITTLSGSNISYSGIGTISTTSIDLGYVKTGIVTNLTTTGIASIATGVITTLSGSNISYTGIGSFGSVNADIGRINTGIVTNLTTTGIATISTASIDLGYVKTGIVTNLTTTGIATISTASIDLGYVKTGIITTLSGSNISYSGIGSFGSINADIGRINTGIITTLSGSNISYTGIGSFGSVNADTGFINTGIVTNLTVSGLSTFTNGPVLIGSGTLSGRASELKLQVTGDACFIGGGTSVGIGTTTPAAVFDLRGNARFGSPTSANAYSSIFHGVNVDLGGGVLVSGLNFSVNSGNVYFRENSNNTLTLANGSVGIGTTNPTSTLTVQGGGRFTGVVTASSFYGDGSTLSNIVAGVGINTAGGNVGYGATILDFRGSGISQVTVSSGIATINITGGGTTSTGGGESYWVQTVTGIHTLSNVGVGTTNPTSALTVKGNTSLETLNVSGVSTFPINVAVGVDFAHQSSLGKFRISGDGFFGNGRIGFYDSSNNLKASWDSSLSTGSIDIYNYINSGTQNITISAGSSVVLQHGGTNTKLQTLGTGVTVTGTTFTDNLTVSGGSTFTNGPILVGSGTSTGTSAQRLQVTGGAYVSGNLGIGSINPTEQLDVVGNGKFTGIVTASSFSGSLNASNLTGIVSTAVLASGTADSTTFLRGDQTWYSLIEGATITNDNSTDTDFYVGFSQSPSGTLSTLTVSSNNLLFNPFSGNLSATQFTSLSDATQKTNVRPIDNAIDLTKKLQGVRFDWINNNKPSIGVIAQEVEKILPEIVETNSDGIKSVCYGNIIGVLIEAIKEQQVRIEELERKLDA